MKKRCWSTTRRKRLINMNKPGEVGVIILHLYISDNQIYISYHRL